MGRSTEHVTSIGYQSRIWLACFSFRPQTPTDSGLLGLVSITRIPGAGLKMVIFLHVFQVYLKLPIS